MSDATLDSFTTFAELLRYLRRRVGLKRCELGLAMGYSEAQITRLKGSQRTPDVPAVERACTPHAGVTACGWWRAGREVIWEVACRSMRD